jgi:hypothetical protein
VERQRGTADHPHLHERVRGVRIGVTEVGTRTEVTVGTAHDDDTIVLVRSALPEHLCELAPHLPVGRVLLLRTVQHHRENAAGPLDDKGVHECNIIQASWYRLDDADTAPDDHPAPVPGTAQGRLLRASPELRWTRGG